MKLEEVLFVVLDEYADWEAASLAAALNEKPEQGKQRYCVKTVSLNKEPVRSIGGFRTMPDYAVAAPKGGNRTLPGVGQGQGAGAPAEYGSASPIASDPVAMVLAVNWAPQAPAEGQATCSNSSRSASDMAPTECLPTASNTSCTVTGLPLKVPGRMEPP